jgi:L-2-hydroxyglutarate oxidase LhgO
MAGKNKTIVIVGGGMVGLTSAYMLAKNHPNNKVVILEKNVDVLAETSK